MRVGWTFVRCLLIGLVVQVYEKDEVVTQGQMNWKSLCFVYVVKYLAMLEVINLCVCFVI